MPNNHRVFTSREKTFLTDCQETYAEERRVASEHKKNRNLGLGICAADIAIKSLLVLQPDSKSTLVFIGCSLLAAGSELRRRAHERSAENTADMAADLSSALDIIPPAWVLGVESYVTDDCLATPPTDNQVAASLG